MVLSPDITQASQPDLQASLSCFPSSAQSNFVRLFCARPCTSGLMEVGDLILAALQRSIVAWEAIFSKESATSCLLESSPLLVHEECGGRVNRYRFGAQTHPSGKPQLRIAARQALVLALRAALSCRLGAENNCLTLELHPGGAPERLNLPAAIDDRPAPDPVSDKEWVNRVLRETSDWIRNKAPKEETNREVEGNQIVAYLEAGCPPNFDPKNGRIEAHYCSTAEARDLVDTRNETVPIITHNQQPFDWRDEHGPIHSLFTQWIKNAMRNKKVFVQIPTLPTTDGTQTKRTLEQVYRKFVLKDGREGELWKLLDLENPVPTPTPPFLTSAKCQLLRRLRDEMSKGLPPEIGSFILLSEGGNHTISHVDSHGFGTFITAQEGRHGFGWVSHPSEQDRRMWREDPYSVRHLARYIVLRPGQTVFFPGNTIHFVFRALNEPTLATGGHILKWSTIMGWLRIMKFQQCDKSGANDDVTAASIRQWTSPLNKIIDSCIDSGDVDDIGGLEEAQRISDAIKDWKNFDASQ
ncbi:hypothetical protein NM208_g8462 [Fusarium decemcellulare]|uniref:Uncharacterized protein n=1 Tax=Fusarium decemcellulare TaxID=57161 RepID=A0ACC1S5E1_9HYPO|nr:hypothetical protein NM208_g8462 [Fusarium decemcellulare]